MQQGIVDYVDSKIIKGSFVPDFTKNVLVKSFKTGEVEYCVNADIAQLFAQESISTGMYHYDMTLRDRIACKTIANVVNNEHKGYNIEDNVDEMSLKREVHHSYQPFISKRLKIISRYLGGITFGAEIECMKGYLPEHIQYRTGTVICRDGSLRNEDNTVGPEFTTIPLSGAKGVQSLITLGKELMPRTKIDLHCAYHIHIGNLPTSRMFLVSLYKLALSIQDEVFAMFPYYKNDERLYANKEKNYCKRLKRLAIFSLKNNKREAYDNYINDNYIRLFSFLANGNIPDRKYNRKTKTHPQNGHKWNRSSRYYWINFMNAIFSDRNTIEFRIHEGTRNPQKIVSWLFICNAIVQTAITQAGSIISGKKISLTEVLNYYGTTFKTSNAMMISEYLKQYYEFRKNYFQKDYENSNFLSNEFLENDSNFKVDFPSISDLFK